MTTVRGLFIPSRRFNLVIEVLLISSLDPRAWYWEHSLSFQSRNRGSFDFKYFLRQNHVLSLYRFNLVIEVLLISSEVAGFSVVPPVKFQSRNRGSFDFKDSTFMGAMIAFLFQSRNRGSFDFKCITLFESKGTHAVSIS